MATASSTTWWMLTIRTGCTRDRRICAPLPADWLALWPGRSDVQVGIRYGSPEVRSLRPRLWSSCATTPCAPASSWPAAWSVPSPGRQHLRSQEPKVAAACTLSLIGLILDARLDWDQIMDGIRQHGIRNAAQTTLPRPGRSALSPAARVMAASRYRPGLYPLFQGWRQ